MCHTYTCIRTTCFQEIFFSQADDTNLCLINVHQTSCFEYSCSIKLPFEYYNWTYWFVLWSTSFYSHPHASTAAIAFFNKVAEVAEAEGHHPDLKLHNYRDVEITVSTHAAGALTYPDFVLASKLDALDVDYSPKWLQQFREKSSKTAAWSWQNGHDKTFTVCSQFFRSSKRNEEVYFPVYFNITRCGSQACVTTLNSVFFNIVGLSHCEIVLG